MSCEIPACLQRDLAQQLGWRSQVAKCLCKCSLDGLIGMGMGVLLLCNFVQKEGWVVSPFLPPLTKSWPSSFFSPFNKTKYIDQVIHFNGILWYICTKRGMFVWKIRGHDLSSGSYIYCSNLLQQS